mmetsp:Transcript_145856/g.265083  ORF Transcript_145856/g.265083 Transcript_145856/m.265083 type:complete len:222 (+) Transcript_145856:857-1522(+)
MNFIFRQRSLLYLSFFCSSSRNSLTRVLGDIFNLTHFLLVSHLRASIVKDLSLLSAELSALTSSPSASVAKSISFNLRKSSSSRPFINISARTHSPGFIDARCPPNFITSLTFFALRLSRPNRLAIAARSSATVVLVISLSSIGMGLSTPSWVTKAFRGVGLGGSGFSTFSFSTFSFSTFSELASLVVSTIGVGSSAFSTAFSSFTFSSLTIAGSFMLSRM